MKFLFRLLPIALLLLGCKKNESATDDRDAPAIDISTPVSNQSFTVGATVSIAAAITGAGRIVQVHLHISKEESGQLLVDVHRYPGESSFDLNESFVPPASGSYRIRIIARDNSGNESFETVTVQAS
jgi:hypothetical protein